MLEEKLKNIPKNAGCYLFKDKKGQIIYVGKAKHLPNRVKSYFSNKNHTSKTKLLVENVSDVDFLTTLDENSAIILENDLIKSHKPKFNIKLKDDRSKKWYLTLTNETFPRLEVKNESNLDSEPLICVSSSNICYELHDLLHDIFNLRSCSYDIIPENVENNKFSTCLEYHMGRCDAPCVGNINKFVYNSTISDLKQVISFNIDQYRGKLTRLMGKFSKDMEFEKANDIKFRLDALNKYEKCIETTRIGGYLVIADEFKTTYLLKNTPIDIEMYDNSHIMGDCQVSALVRYTNGKKNTSEYRKFNIKTVEGPDDYASFDEVLRRRFIRLLKEKKKLPDMVIIDGGKGQLSVAKKVFNELSLLDRIDLVSISKNSSHKSDILHFTDGNSVKFENSKFFNLLATIQDEVHRFVITFHRKKRSKSMLS
ncbi:MAG: excinuclease subunit [Bacteroidota bacterium]|jgi:excinuclease ABC subunit C